MPQVWLSLYSPALCPHLSARLLAVFWLTVLVRNVFSVIAAAISVVTYSGFAVLTWRYGLAWQVQLFSLLTAFISAFGSPALYSLLPAVVEHDYLVQANGFVRTLRNIAYVGAPVLAGLIAAHFSAQVLFAIASLSGIVTIILLALVHVPKSFDDTKDEDQQQSLVDALKTAPHLFKEYRWLLIGVIFWAITLAIDSGAGDVILPLYVIPLSSKITWSYVSAALSIGYIAGIGFELGGVTWGSALQQRSPEKYFGTYQFS